MKKDVNNINKTVLKDYLNKRLEYLYSIMEDKDSNDREQMGALHRCTESVHLAEYFDIEVD
jgi:hypothetical protein